MAMAKLSQKSSVSRSNELIRGQLTVTTLHQKRLIYSVMSAINPCVDVLDGATDQQVEYYYRQNFDETLFTFDYREYMAFWGLTSHAMTKEISKACKQVIDIKLYSYLMDDGTVRDLNAIELAEHKGNKIILRLTPSIMPYMINLHRRLMGYTSIPLIYMVDFQSRYSFKLMEVLLSYYSRGNKTVEIDLAELRKTFDCEGKHKLYADFKRRVIDIAVEEIEKIATEKAKIVVEEVRSATGGRGRPSVTALRFRFDFPNYRAAREASKKSPAVQGDVTGYGGPTKRMLELKAEVEKLRVSGELQDY
ncbi:hypothetical protein CF130_16775 [Aeromonas dhakensis]|nr:hypothetical protein CF130_16775 [Aeromonas dhakensis]